MWKFNMSVIGMEEDDHDDNLFEQTDDGLCSLSPTQRLYAFAGCLFAGVAFMFLSVIVFIKPIKFAVLFSFGNMFAIGSTTFLIGPTQQMRMMFDPVRFFATVIYIGLVVVTLICALLLHNRVLTIVAIICEISALIWYSLSYIPFARGLVSQLAIRLCDTEI